jgi:hypothetical protein
MTETQAQYHAMLQAYSHHHSPSPYVLSPRGGGAPSSAFITDSELLDRSHSPGSEVDYDTIFSSTIDHHSSTGGTHPDEDDDDNSVSPVNSQSAGSAGGGHGARAGEANHMTTTTSTTTTAGGRATRDHTHRSSSSTSSLTNDAEMSMDKDGPEAAWRTSAKQLQHQSNDDDYEDEHENDSIKASSHTPRRNTMQVSHAIEIKKEPLEQMATSFDYNLAKISTQVRGASSLPNSATGYVFIICDAGLLTEIRIMNTEKTALRRASHNSGTSNRMED